MLNITLTAVANYQNDGLFKVTKSHVWYTSDHISKRCTIQMGL